MVNIDLSEWARLLEPKRSVFSFKKKHLGESFPKFDWKVEEGECPELSPGRLPLADSESAKTIYLYNEQAVMQRLNDDGWLGFAESFMAGEWDAHDPSYVWEDILDQRRRYMRKEWSQRKRPLVAELKPRTFEFYEAFLDPTFGLAAADFVSGPRTQMNEKGVKEVYLEDPLPLPLRKDLYDAQRRRVSRTLMDADLRRKNKILFVGSEWGETAFEAAQFGCDVTVLCDSEEVERVLTARANAENIGQLRLIPGLYSNTGVYDVIISVSPIPNDRFLDVALQLAQTDLVPGGRVVIERPLRGRGGAGLPLAWWWSYVDSNTLLRSRKEIVEEMRATGLELSQATHCDHHYIRSLELWDESFRASVSQLGAHGYDAAYRRLWRTALAIVRACVRNGAVEYKRLVFEKR